MYCVVIVLISLFSFLRLFVVGVVGVGGGGGGVVGCGGGGVLLLVVVLVVGSVCGCVVFVLLIEEDCVAVFLDGI